MVSVLMCTYNRRFCLKQAIDSVLCQTYPDFEFVIVDDGSTDGTEELIKSYQDPRIRYFKLNRNSFYSKSGALSLPRRLCGIYEQR